MRAVGQVATRLDSPAWFCAGLNTCHFVGDRRRRVMAGHARKEAVAMLRPCQAFTLSLLERAKAGVVPRALAAVVVVAAFAGAQPAYAAPPSNDAPSGATLINALPFSDAVTIDEATTD